MGFIWFVLALIAAFRMFFQDHGSSYGGSLLLAGCCVGVIGGVLAIGYEMSAAGMDSASAIIITADTFAMVVVLLGVLVSTHLVQCLASIVCSGFVISIAFCIFVNCSDSDLSSLFWLLFMLNIVWFALSIVGWTTNKERAIELMNYLLKMDLPEIVVKDYVCTRERGEYAKKLVMAGTGFDEKQEWAYEMAQRMLIWQRIEDREYFPWYDPETHTMDLQPYAPENIPEPIYTDIKSFVRIDAAPGTIPSFRRLT